MALLLDIADQALRQQIYAVAASAIARTSKDRIVLYIFAGFCAALALIFGAISAFFGLATLYSLPVAAALTAAGLLGLAGFTLLGAVLHKSMRRRKFAHMQANQWQVVDNMVTLAAQELEEPIRAYPKTAALIAGIAGMVAGRQLH